MQQHGGDPLPLPPSWPRNSRRAASIPYQFSGDDTGSMPSSEGVSSGFHMHTAATGPTTVTGTPEGAYENTGAGYYGGSSRPTSRPSSTYGALPLNSVPGTGLHGQGRGNGADEQYRTNLNKLIQNFFMKAAMIIIQSRMTVPPLHNPRTNERRVNKWVGSGGDDFNLELDDTDAFREELHPWKTCDIFVPPLPPLVIETYIDAKDLTSNQTLVILDEHGSRWNVDAAMRRTVSAAPPMRGAGQTSDVKQDIILERWIIELRAHNNHIASPELSGVYQLGIFFFRSLFAYTGLLPAQKLWKRLAKVKVQNSPLKVMCRVITADAPPAPWDGLEAPLIEGEIPVTNSYSLGTVETPAGDIRINVTYRKNAEFRVDDSEELLSSHFINMDEQRFESSFKPHSHQRAFSQPQFTARQDLAHFGSIPSPSLREFDQHGTYSLLNQPMGVSSSLLAASRAGHNAGPSNSGSPGDPTSMSLRSIQGSKASLRSIESVDIQRRPSLSFHPFKASSLSASPASDVMASSPRASVTRLSIGTTTAPVTARARAGVSPTAQRSSLPQESPTPSTSESPRPGSVRYSTSFGQRKPRPMTATSKADDDNSSGKGSYSSSFAAPGSTFFPQSVPGPSEDDQLASFLKLVDEKPSLHIFSPSESATGAGSALSKYQLMRDSHNALSESLSASLTLQRTHSSGHEISSIQHVPPPPSYSPPPSPGKPISSFTPHHPDNTSHLSKGLTTEYGSNHPRHYPFHEQRTYLGAAEHLTIDTAIDSGQQTAATTAPLSIPSSPRQLNNTIRRPSSYSQHHQPTRFGVSDDYGQSRHVEPLVSSSLGSRETVPLSIRQLAELRAASEEELHSRETLGHREPYPPPDFVSYQQKVELSSRGAYGILGTVSRMNPDRFTIRGRDSPGGSTATLDREREISSAAIERTSLYGRSTPNCPRGYDDDDLLFTMSDMKFDQDKSGSGDSGKGSDMSNFASRRPGGPGGNW